jgi:hypothetical protein
VQLIHALWADKTTTKISTSETPFILVYGKEEIILSHEMEIATCYLAFHIKELDNNPIN